MSNPVRYHSSDDMDGNRDLVRCPDPVAVVLRPDGSADVYGAVSVVDQRPDGPAAKLARRLASLAEPGRYAPGDLGTNADDPETAWTLPFRRRDRS